MRQGDFIEATRLENIFRCSLPRLFCDQLRLRSHDGNQFLVGTEEKSDDSAGVADDTANNKPLKSQFSNSKLEANSKFKYWKFKTKRFGFAIWEI